MAAAPPPIAQQQQQQKNKPYNIYFVSGHGDLVAQEWEDHYVPLLKAACADPDCAGFVVGDFKGADTMAQEYLRERDDVAVYHMFEKPRTIISPHHVTVGGFKTDEERDASMTYNSTHDIVWVRKPAIFLSPPPPSPLPNKELNDGGGGGSGKGAEEEEKGKNKEKQKKKKKDTKMNVALPLDVPIFPSLSAKKWKGKRISGAERNLLRRELLLQSVISGD